jgi:tetratricopeptide (TPR) repeat protein
MTSLSVCSRLRSLRHIQGRPAEAAALLSEVVEGYKMTLGRQDPSTIKNLGNLGLVLHHSGRLEDALPCLKESLDAKRSNAERDHSSQMDPDILSSVNNLGNLYKSMGLYVSSAKNAGSFSTTAILVPFALLLRQCDAYRLTSWHGNLHCPSNFHICSRDH